MTLTTEQTEFMRLTEPLIEHPRLSKVLSYANLARLAGDQGQPVIPDEVYGRTVELVGHRVNAHYVFSPHEIHRRVMERIRTIGERHPSQQLVSCGKLVGEKWSLMADSLAKLDPNNRMACLQSVQEFWRDCFAELDYQIPHDENFELYDHGPKEWVNINDPTEQAWVDYLYQAFMGENSIMFGTTVGGALPKRTRTFWKSIDVYRRGDRTSRIARLLREPRTFKKALWIDCNNFTDPETFGRECSIRSDLAYLVDKFVLYPDMLFMGEVNGTDHTEEHLVKTALFLKGLCEA